MSLRARLLIGLVALAVLGLGAMAIATYEEQRSFLLSRVDQQVAGSEFLVAGQLGVLHGIPPVPLRRPNLPPRSRSTTLQASGTYGALLGSGGKVLKADAFAYGQSADSPPALPSHPPLSKLSSARLDIFTVNSQAGSGLRYRAAAFSVGDGRIMVVAVPLREVDQTLARLTLVESLVGVGVILALIALGWVVIRVGLRPLERIGRVAGEISHGDLTRRVGTGNPRTEVGRLAQSLNEMLMQIEQAFADRRESEDRLRQFLADASHELRTPLASIRGYAEAFQMGAAIDSDTLERAMARIQAEAARMGVLVEDLLLLSWLDKMPETRRELVDLNELAEQAGQDARAIAPTRIVTVNATGPLAVLADSDQMRQVLANLTRNALVHTPPHSPVEISVWRDADRAMLEVRDHGAGLPAGAEDQVFGRFWRNEGGRRRGPAGAGLGLAIVQAIVQAHHGEVHAYNAPDGGAVFRVAVRAEGIAESATPSLDHAGASVGRTTQG